MQQIIDKINQSTNNLERSVAVLKQADIGGDSSWSVAEIIEHLVIVESGILKIITKSRSKTPEGISLISAETMEKTIGYDGRKIPAPEFLIPSKRFSSAADAMDELKELRKKITTAVKSGEADLNAGYVYRHPIMGDMTYLDWLNFMTIHSDKHNRQILKIIESHNE